MPLWDEVKREVREMLLQPERLIPAVRAQLDSGKSMDHLEQDLKTNQQRLEMMDEAEQKALRLHLHLPNYPLEKLEAELHRIQDQRQELIAEHCNLERRMRELKQATVDEEGIRRFCQTATRNLDSMDDGQWRVLLESMRLRPASDGREFHAKIALPVVEERRSAIVLCSSQNNDR
jgi:chromosome segregation ATPase